MTEKEQQRIVKRRLAVLRHADEGEEGLRERSRRPLSSPRATQGEVVGKII
jgi:hypothetical protein